MHFGATLRMLRVDSGVSLRALAESVGVSSAYLSRVENGHDAPPTPDRLVAIADSLGVPPALLVGLTDRMPPSVTEYLARVPAASNLFSEIARRRLTTAQVARVQAFLDAEFPVRGASASEPRIAPLLGRGGIVGEIVCSHVDDLLDVIATRLARATGSSVSALARALREREHAASTAIGAGVSVPHAVVSDVEPTAVLAILRRPLPADTPDGAPLRVAIGLVHPPPADRIVPLLAHVAGLAREDLVEHLASARDPRRALALLE